MAVDGRVVVALGAAVTGLTTARRTRMGARSDRDRGGRIARPGTMATSTAAVRARPAASHARRSAEFARRASMHSAKSSKVVVAAVHADPDADEGRDPGAAACAKPDTPVADGDITSHWKQRAVDAEQKLNDAQERFAHMEQQLQQLRQELADAERTYSDVLRRCAEESRAAVAQLNARLHDAHRSAAGSRSRTAMVVAGQFIVIVGLIAMWFLPGLVRLAPS